LDVVNFNLIRKVIILCQSKILDFYFQSILKIILIILCKKYFLLISIPVKIKITKIKFDMNNFSNKNTLLDKQILYYRARSKEYNEWFYRQGRYDCGRVLNQQWFDEVEQIRQALNTLKPTGHILEIACGTGLWTEQLIQYAEEITALDAASEMIVINQAYVRSAKVRYIQADIFNWNPKERYDFVFFGFWLSHVPVEKFSSFWSIVDSSLKPNGRIFFVDSKYNMYNAANVHQLEDSETTISKRVINDGREFQVIKILYNRDKLLNQLNRLGWEFDIKETGNFCIYGSGYKR
jgi:2-polyprenyl-3-methyl-5-hydroxy-6-metoxy-1,4-benzoquinol methylase